jgi:hypothetical protein
MINCSQLLLSNLTCAATAGRARPGSAAADAAAAAARVSARDKAARAAALKAAAAAPPARPARPKSAPMFFAKPTRTKTTSTCKARHPLDPGQASVSGAVQYAPLAAAAVVGRCRLNR